METRITCSSYDTDVVESRDQNYELPSGYEWIPERLSFRAASAVLYGIGTVFAHGYGRLVWDLKVVGREKFRECEDSGYYIYGNHTQPFGDVFLPVVVNRGRRIYTVVSPANYGIPVIGKLLPYLGALPLPKDLTQVRRFLEALNRRAVKGQCVVIFPEAHVWPFCTAIRPFGSAAFHYPVSAGLPVYCMTTTYRARKHRRTPQITIYVDGPFRADPSLPRGEQKKQLCGAVRKAMEERSRENTCEYIHYELASETYPCPAQPAAGTPEAATKSDEA